jgi:hypothetical protein
MRVVAAALLVALLAACGSAGPTVELSVSAQDPDTVAEISYTVGSESHKVSDVDVPWTTTVDGAGKVSLTAGLAPNPDAVVAGTTFTCKVTIGGKVVATKTGKNTVTCQT